MHSKPNGLPGMIGHDTICPQVLDATKKCEMTSATTSSCPLVCMAGEFALLINGTREPTTCASNNNTHESIGVAVRRLATCPFAAPSQHSAGAAGTPCSLGC